MLIRRFVDEYAAAAPFLDTTENELRALDRSGSHQLRWVADREGHILGVAAARQRPDGRTFIRFGTTPHPLIGALSNAAAAELGAVHAVARSTDDRNGLEESGFVVEGIDDEFEISFKLALARLGRQRMPSRFDLVAPHLLEMDRLAALDTELRNDVPGTDGWVTTSEMFQTEIDSPEYDPSGYLIAVERATDGYAGLARFWNNPDKPRLGLLAVTREHRRSLLATALLRRALEGASQWGSHTFATSTSPSNRDTYPALTRLVATPVTRRYRMVRTATARLPHT